jgi:collagenase-like PrtC family protease
VELQLALNTIPRSRERAALLIEIRRVLELGVRALIVNDVGILDVLHTRFPELALTASIGCGAQNPADVAFFAERGAAAVVLPATLGPDEARACVAVGGITIELMVHMVEEYVLLGKCAMPSYVPPPADPDAGGIARRPPPDRQQETGRGRRLLPDLRGAVVGHGAGRAAGQPPVPEPPALADR